MYILQSCVRFFLGLLSSLFGSRRWVGTERREVNLEFDRPADAQSPRLRDILRCLISLAYGRFFWVTVFVVVVVVVCVCALRVLVNTWLMATF